VYFGGASSSSGSSLFLERPTGAGRYCPAGDRSVEILTAILSPCKPGLPSSYTQPETAAARRARWPRGQWSDLLLCCGLCSPRFSHQSVCTLSSSGRSLFRHCRGRSSIFTALLRPGVRTSMFPSNGASCTTRSPPSLSPHQMGRRCMPGTSYRWGSIGAMSKDSWRKPSGPAPDFKQTPAFELLRDDPGSLLVLYLHGAGGTLGSGYRPASYRAASAGAPDRIHVVAVEYRGFGLSTGTPSEDGLLTDAATLVDWAMAEAGIPAHRIIIWGQSSSRVLSSSRLLRTCPRLRPPIVWQGQSPFSVRFPAFLSSTTF